MVLILVPVSSREVSFFFIGFPAPPRPERCWLRLWLLKLSAGISSCSGRSLSRDSFLSQTNTVTPARQQETALISPLPPQHQIPTHLYDAWGTHPSQSQSCRPEGWIYWSVNKYLRSVKSRWDASIKVAGQVPHTTFPHAVTHILDSVPGGMSRWGVLGTDPSVFVWNHTYRFDPCCCGILQLTHEICWVGVIDVDGPLISGENAVIRVAAGHNQVVDRVPRGLQRNDPHKTTS